MILQVVAPPFQPEGTSAMLHPPTTPFTYSRNGSDRTVHTITFKLWNPDGPNKELFVQETRLDGNTHSYDPEHFFFKLMRHQEQANRLSDYWRSHYGAPLRHTASTSLADLYANDFGPNS